MNIQLLADSGIDYHPTLLPESITDQNAPFKISIDNQHDYEDSSITSILKKLTASAPKIGTAAPSPHDFLDRISDEVDAFIVTISAKLSGAYQNAMIAKEERTQNIPDKKIHVFDSESASAGESLIYLKIKELLTAEIPFDEIIEKINGYIKTMHTFFILNSLDTLYNAGRIGSVAAKVGQLLHIVPIMGEDGAGSIMLKAKARGPKQAFSKLVDLIKETQVNFKETVLAITHVNAFEQAVSLKNNLEASCGFKEIHIFEASSLSAVYAGEGGIVLAF